MSIASEITSIGENLKKDYQAIANLGADLTNVDKNIENIAELLDGVYDNLPKTEYQEGTEVNLGKTIKGKLDYEDDKVGYGDTEQDSTKGYNIVNTLNYSTTTINGVTCTNNGDGTFTINGTANATTQFNLINGNNVVNWSAGTYKLLGQPSGDSGWDKFIMFFNNWDGVNCYSGETKTLSSSTTSLTLTIRIGSGMTYNNLTFFPMITTNTSLTNADCEKYTGGQASPNPNYEQEIKCVRGRNLADYSQTYTSSSLSNYGAFNLALENSIPIKTNKTYYFSADIRLKSGSGTTKMNVIRSTITTGQTTSAITNPNMTTSFQRYVFSNTYTTEQTLSQIAFQILTDSSVVIEVKNIMIAEENIQYLPYNTIEEVVSGKNLFEPVLYNNGTQIVVNNISSANVTDGEFSFTASGADMFFGTVRGAGGEYTDDRGIKIYRNGNSKISYRSTNTALYRTFITAYDKNGISLGYTEIAISYGTYTFPENCEFITFRFGTSVAESGTTYKTKFMVAYGDTIPTYEPYITPTSYQLSLGDIELCGIGNYEDELIYDVENDKVYKNEKIGEVTFTGEEGWTQTGARQDTFYLPQDFFSQYLYPVQYLYSNIAKFNKYITSTGEIDETGSYIYVNGSAGYVYFQFPNISTLTEFKNIIQNSLAIYIQEPTLTEITGTLKAQVKALYNAQSNNGTTIITSNGDLPLVIKVRGLKGE